MKYDVVAPYKEDILEEEIIHGPKLLLKYFYIDENEQKTVSAFFFDYTNSKILFKKQEINLIFITYI